MTDREKTALILLLSDPSKFGSVYSGRPGCACGCRGKHSEKRGQITRVLNVLLANLDDLDVSDDNIAVETVSETTGERQRLYIAYRA